MERWLDGNTVLSEPTGTHEGGTASASGGRIRCQDGRRMYEEEGLDLLQGKWRENVGTSLVLAQATIALNMEGLGIENDENK